MKIKRILVTGGAGYIGSVLTQKLLEHNYAVTVVDAGYFGIAHLPKNLNLTFVKKDIRTILPKLLSHVDAVCHLAGFSNDPMADFNPSMCRDINTHASVQLANIAAKSGVKRFIFASSCSIYSDGNDTEDLKDETSQVQPKAHYSQSKYEAEKKLLKITQPGFDVVVLRKGTVFGYSPRMRYDLVINTMVKDAIVSGKINVFCNGNQWRPLIHVSDVASAYLDILKSPKKAVAGQIFNLTAGNYLIKNAANDVKNSIEKLTGRRIIINFVETKHTDRSYQVNYTKAKRAFHFKAKVTISQAVSDIYSKIKRMSSADFDNPRYYNIRCMDSIISALK